MRGRAINTSSDTAWPVWLCVLAFAAAAVATRLPQLLSPRLLVDGDEAVLGLMARHLVTRGEVPWFFWGQRYGLASIEASVAAVAFAVAGTGAVSLKVAMLAIWTVGVVFLFLALVTLVGRESSVWIAAVFVVTPAWAVWSMKARGGYLTAFAAAAALLWLLVQERERQTPLRWLAAGALTGLIYLTQPLWLLGMLPIALIVLVSRRSVSCGACYLGVVAAVVLLVRTSTEGSAGPTFGNPDVPGSVPLMAQQLYEFLTGAQEYAWSVDSPGIATTVLAVFWYGVLAVSCVLQVYRLFARRYRRWSHLLFLGICSTLIGELVLLHARDPRYLLPVGALLVLLAGVEFDDFIARGLVPKRAAAAVVAVLLLFGSASMVEFRRFSPLWGNAAGGSSERARFRQVLTYLHVEGVTHVFSMNGLLDTQLAFYSDEGVIPRWRPLEERYAPYVSEVDRALRNGERVAVVGYTNTSGAPGCWDAPICTGGIEGMVPDPETIYTVDGKYFVYVGASIELLDRLHFQFEH